MKITSDLFHAYLKCSTKCWLRATNEPATENDYPKFADPEWVAAVAKTEKDGQLVDNISNQLLAPAAFSAVR